MDDGQKAETLPTGEIESIRPKSGLVERQCKKGEKMFARNAVFKLFFGTFTTQKTCIKWPLLDD